MIYDLHIHSNHSDGALAPVELVQRALQRSVHCLSITDHDTLAAYACPALTEACELANVALVPGIELSTQWRKRGIHVLGLNIDPTDEHLQSGVERQQRVRQQRAVEIAARLKRNGVDVNLPRVKEIAAGATIGRPHFARHLTEIGTVKSVRQAFRKYLGAGKPGDVPHDWAPLEEVVSWIVRAGGTAVLAHPAHYKLTHTKLQQLLDEFIAAGGRSMEVVSGSQQAALTCQLAEFADRNGLLASCGSDFHSHDNGWSDIGKFAALPASCNPVWSVWQQC